MSDADVWRAVATDILGRGRLDLIDEYFMPDYVEHTPLPPSMPGGREGFREFASGLQSAFPDLRFEVVHQFQQGDMHIGHVRATGTMTGEFAGMPPTNKAATWEEIHIGRMSGGQVAEHWGVADQLGMLQQLGFIPPAP